MTSLLDEIKTIRPRSACAVAALPLTDEDRAGLTEALGDRSISGGAILRVLRRRGMMMAESTLRRHRRGECSCGDC